MAARRTRKRSRSKSSPTTSTRTVSINLSVRHIGAILLLSALLFFAMMSTGGRLHNILTFLLSRLVGQNGVPILFGLIGLTGLGLLLKPQIASPHLWLKIATLAFVSGLLLNFRILDNISPVDPSQPFPFTAIAEGREYGGILQAGTLLTTSYYLFNGQLFMTKLIIILASLITVGLIIRSMGILRHIPAVAFDLSLPDLATAKAARPSSKKQQNQQKKSAKRLAPHADQHIDDEIDTMLTDASPAGSETPPSPSATTIKNILKAKLSQKKTAQHDETKPDFTHPDFPADIPSFSADLLHAGQLDSNVDEAYIIRKAETLRKKLDEFNIPVEVKGFDIGPSIIQIKIMPQAGIKISKIEGLKKDLSLALKAKSLRIIAPIPGTSCVGIEIRNPQPQLVTLKDILDTHAFADQMKETRSNVCIGKSITGEPFIKPLQKMPHLLVAGATGSGKSVGINDFILSLIYQNSPRDLKFIMIDPKQVELGIYEGLPYLLAPIITEPAKAISVLKRAVGFMNERYKALKQSKVRNIDEYNKKHPTDTMYRLVIIIDELADLMLSGDKKQTEQSIARLAQMARAVGIHLIVATQRPSVDVITGLIKANIPTRIAFGVVSQIDSRTILDTKGAEDLVGKGDLLYSDPQHKYPIRIQGPLVQTDETEAIVIDLQQKYMNGLTEDEIYHPEIMQVLTAPEGGEFSAAGNYEGDEELIQQAIEIIAQTRKASATMLQRKLNVGFARAARIMDALEAQGIVGPQEGAKAREILI